MTCTDTCDVTLWKVEREEIWPRLKPGRHRMILSNFVDNCEEYEGDGKYARPVAIDSGTSDKENTLAQRTQ